MYCVVTGWCNDWNYTLKKWNEMFSNENAEEFEEFSVAFDYFQQMESNQVGDAGVYVELYKDGEDGNESLFVCVNNIIGEPKETCCMNFHAMVGKAIEYGLDIHVRGNMLEFVKYCIDEDNLAVALHVLNGVNANYADYYSYDYSMGTLESIEPIKRTQDIIDIYGYDFLKEV